MMDLSEYKNLASRWHHWLAIKTVCIQCAMLIFERIVGLED